MTVRVLVTPVVVKLEVEPSGAVSRTWYWVSTPFLSLSSGGSQSRKRDLALTACPTRFRGEAEGAVGDNHTCIRTKEHSDMNFQSERLGCV